MAEISDHYAAWSQGREIGTIRHARDASGPDRSWEWFIVVPMGLPAWASGDAPDRDTAIRAFSAAWGRLLKETQPQRLQRAWELGHAAQSRSAPSQCSPSPTVG
ncbi:MULTISPECIES: hypothetical protein [unclassified Bradyrhizobium]|uniref:hypothetical protein n=1 Tax=unclassified Bradyrhizobium TaxID=2631580 RepID=UPI00188B8945|nr:MULTISPECIES: hypothetical protein [unclassified Bradyrhizobium]MDN4983832.1 hypothetical protein [Bradyrhizobium sp. WYCCWR 13022]QOZ52177.1 hypothetical protein XH90_12965 [Bradyrhizobium sp. CCBAU 53338]